MKRWIAIPGSPLQTGVAVTLALAALSMTATLLVEYYNQARLARAATHVAAGTLRMAEGDRHAAIVELRAALALDRHNPDYVLALATTLLEGSLPHDAEPYLDEVLAVDPTSGPANRTRARTATALGEPDADVFYRRAYFGTWPAGTTADRLATGFERVEHLLGSGQPEQARGMLAQLVADGHADTDQQLRIATLLMRADAPADAEPILRTLADRRPGDTAVWRALATVTFGRHDYASALTASQRWLDLAPEAAEARQIAEAARAVEAMDPTLPHLAATERAARARRLLSATLDAFNTCRSARAAVPGDEARADAVRLLARQTGADDDELVRAATRLWRERQARCASPAPETDVLTRVFAALASSHERR